MAGVALGVGALLGLTEEPAQPSLLGAQPGAVSAQTAGGALTGAAPQESLSPEDLAPAVVPTPAAPTRAAVPARPRAAAPARTRPARPPVAVLNNSTRPGLADRASARFSGNGWPVSLTGNFRGRLRATSVYYEPGQRAAAQRFASTFRGIDRVLARPSNIPGPRGLVVVLTRHFPA